MSRPPNSRVIENQLKKIDEIFLAHSADLPIIKILEFKTDKNCDVHGYPIISSRRESIDSVKSVSRKGSSASNPDKKNSLFCSTERLNENFRKKNRNSITSFTELVERNVTPIKREALDRELYSRPRRGSMPIIDDVKPSNGKKSSLDSWNSKLFKGMEHPSNFPNMLRSSSQNLNAKNGCEVHGGRRSSSSWNVNHFHNYPENSSENTSDRRQSMHRYSISSTGSSPEPKKELHSILKQKKNDEDDLKEIIKRLSFDYSEKEVCQNATKSDTELLSNSDSSSATGHRTPITTLKVTPRRVSIDSLDSRRGSRRLSDFSSFDEADDDIVSPNKRFIKSSNQVSAFVNTHIDVYKLRI